MVGDQCTDRFIPERFQDALNLNCTGETIQDQVINANSAIIFLINH